jgi:uncharacterized membrane protein
LLDIIYLSINIDMHAIKCLIPSLIFFCLLDYLWLGNIGKNLYIDNIGNLLILSERTITPRLIPAFCVYLLFGVMLWTIVLPLANFTITKSFYYGALAGFVIYGIYDMTNLAVFKEWTVFIAIVDWCWGVFLCSTTSGFCAYIDNLLK